MSTVLLDSVLDKIPIKDPQTGEMNIEKVLENTNVLGKHFELPELRELPELFESLNLSNFF